MGRPNKNYNRILNKYYDREIDISKIISTTYQADWVLKPEYRNLPLPDIIEVKGNEYNFNLNGYGDFSSENYEKFNACILNGLTVLVINSFNKSSKCKDKYYMRNKKDLEDIYNV